MLKVPTIQHISKLPLRKSKLLAVGKGPSSASWNPDYLNTFDVIGINHTSTKFNTHIAHFTDYEMFKDQPHYSEFVICPAYMNHQCKTTKSLSSLVYEDDEMGRLYKEKRLFSYDIATPDGFITSIYKENPFLFMYASGVLIVQVAIRLGAKELYTLGIDGGTQYNKDFEPTKGNGLFLDEQMRMIEKLAKGKLEIVRL